MQPSPFTSPYGKFLKFCLQLPSVKYCRLAHAFVHAPNEYQCFLKEILIPKLLSFPKFSVLCASEHTRLLLDLEPSLKSHIICLSDNNPALWNKSRFGIPILEPIEAAQKSDIIFLSTTVYQYKLKKQLRSMNFKGQIISPDQHVPAEFFLNSILQNEDL